MAGHLKAWLAKYHNGVAFTNDCDGELLEHTKDTLKKNFSNRSIVFSNSNFVDNPFREYAPFDTILLDLGISSIHIDNFSRGISFRNGDQVLDMRLDTNSGYPLYQWLNQASLKEIHTVLKEYGEEKYSYRMAKKIIQKRETESIYYTRDLKDICIEVYKKIYPAYQYSNVYAVRNPYVKTFQAFRIHINQELNNLKKTLSFLPQMLKIGGRLFIISFHSLEDRIVKRAFHDLVYVYDSSEFARSYYKKSNFSIPFKKPIIPTKQEIEMNSRSHSAKMRILERNEL